MPTAGAPADSHDSLEERMEQGRQDVLDLDDRHFAVHSERINGSARVRVAGEMDLAVIEAVDREIERAEATDATKIVLDLDQLEFMDASGLRLLLHLSERSARNGRRLRITRAGAPQVRRVMEITGVDRLLPFEDRASAA
jgi:anti-sigma B factor antagonist